MFSRISAQSPTLSRCGERLDMGELLGDVAIVRGVRDAELNRLHFRGGPERAGKRDARKQERHGVGSAGVSTGAGGWAGVGAGTAKSRAASASSE